MQNRPFVFWKNSVIGKRIDTDWAYGAQCIDLFKSYCNNLLGYKMVKTGSAKEAYNNKYGCFDSSREKIVGDHNYMQWDVIFSTNGDNWHVAVISKIVSPFVYVIEQNGSGKNSGSWIGENAIREHKYPMSFFAGVWRCKKIFTNLQLERSFVENKIKTMPWDTSSQLQYKNSLRYQS